MTLEYLIAFPLSAALGALFFLAVVYRFRDRYLHKREKHYIYRCKNCGYIYLFSKNMPMQSCGKCGHLNEIYRQ